MADKQELQQQYDKMIKANDAKVGSYTLREILPIRQQLIDLELAELEAAAPTIDAKREETGKELAEAQTAYDAAMQRLLSAQAADNQAWAKQVGQQTERGRLLEAKEAIAGDLRALETGKKSTMPVNSKQVLAY